MHCDSLSVAFLSSLPPCVAMWSTSSFWERPWMWRWGPQTVEGSMKVSPATKPIWFPKTLLAVFKAYHGIFNLSTSQVLSFVYTEAAIVDPSKLLHRSFWGDATSKCRSESDAYKEYVRVQWEVRALKPCALNMMYSRFRTSSKKRKVHFGF